MSTNETREHILQTAMQEALEGAKISPKDFPKGPKDAAAAPDDAKEKSDEISSEDKLDTVTKAPGNLENDNDTTADIQTNAPQNNEQGSNKTRKVPDNNVQQTQPEDANKSDNTEEVAHTTGVPDDVEFIEPKTANAASDTERIDENNKAAFIKLKTNTEEAQRTSDLGTEEDAKKREEREYNIHEGEEEGQKKYAGLHEDTREHETMEKARKMLEAANTVGENTNQEAKKKGGTFEKIVRMAGETWRKTPLRYKIALGAAFFVGTAFGGTSVVLGSTIGAGITRGFGAAGVYVLTDELLERRHRRKSGAERDEKTLKKDAYIAGVAAISAILAGKAIGEVAHFWLGEGTEGIVETPKTEITGGIHGSTPPPVAPPAEAPSSQAVSAKTTSPATPVEPKAPEEAAKNPFALDESARDAVGQKATDVPSPEVVPAETTSPATSVEPEAPEEAAKNPFAPETPMPEKISMPEITPVTVEASSKGAIQTFVDLKEQLRTIYPDETIRPESVTKLLNKDAIDMAKEYGFYNPNADAESALLMKGDTLGVDSHGNLVYESAAGKTTTLELGAGSQPSEFYSGKMFDYQQTPETPASATTAPESPATEGVAPEDAAYGDTPVRSYDSSGKEIASDKHAPAAPAGDQTGHKDTWVNPDTQNNFVPEENEASTTVGGAEHIANLVNEQFTTDIDHLYGKPLGNGIFSSGINTPEWSQMRNIPAEKIFYSAPTESIAGSLPNGRNEYPFVKLTYDYIKLIANNANILPNKTETIEAFIKRAITIGVEKKINIA